MKPSSPRRWLSRVGLAAAAMTTLAACNAHEVTPFEENIKAENADVFAQAGAAQVDILWVVDNSGSMCEEQLSLRDNFEAFIEELDRVGADFHLAVVTTDMVDPEESGRFQNVPDGTPGPSCAIAVDVTQCPSPDNGQDFPPLVLRSQDYRDGEGNLDIERLKLHFGCNATTGTQGNGFEMGLEAAKTALSPALTGGFNSGFLRDEAFLAILFLTDENDCSDRGALDKTNGNVCEWEEDKLVPVDEYIRFFSDLKGGDPNRIIMAGIVAPDAGIRYTPGEEVQPSCFSEFGGDAFAGYRYQSVIEAFENSAVANICEPPFDNALESLGVLISDAIDLSCLQATPTTCDADTDCPSGQSCAARAAGSSRKFCEGFRVQVEVRRPTPLTGRECSELAGTERLSCELNEGTDFSVNYADPNCSTGISINLNYTLESVDELIFRYPREVSAGSSAPSGDEGDGQ